MEEVLFLYLRILLFVVVKYLLQVWGDPPTPKYFGLEK